MVNPNLIIKNDLKKLKKNFYIYKYETLKYKLQEKKGNVK